VFAIEHNALLRGSSARPATVIDRRYSFRFTSQMMYAMDDPRMTTVVMMIPVEDIMVTG
jgi:hypothetical protein